MLWVNVHLVSSLGATAGKTRLSEEQAGSTLDMSLESMSGDLVGLLKSMFPKREEAPTFLLVGHSMVGPSQASFSALTDLTYLAGRCCRRRLVCEDTE